MRLPTLEVRTRRPQELVDVTARVREAVRAARMEDGVVVVFCPHTTAGVTIQENADPDVQTDLLLALEQAVPDRPARGTYRHAEGNSPAHVKASLVGSSATVIVDRGDLLLGTWQGIYLCEFDGPRPRKLELKLLPVFRPGASPE
jgi:secondary thiamine-phosphate synthase enzyme